MVFTSCSAGGTDRFDAGLALDQLQRGADGIGGGVGGAAQQAVGLAHLDQHGTEIVALGHCCTALLFGHFALAQFHHLGDHLVKAFIVDRVDDLGAGDVKTAFRSRLVHRLRVPQQNDLENPAGQQTAGGAQDTSVGTFGKYDRFGCCLELRFETFKKFHTITSAEFAAGRPNARTRFPDLQF